jgi:hypothetical protein
VEGRRGGGSEFVIRRGLGESVEEKEKERKEEGVIGWLLVIRWRWKDGKRREVVVLFYILPRTKSPSCWWDIHTLDKLTGPQQP